MGNVSALLAHISSSPEQDPDNDDELVKSDKVSESDTQTTLVGQHVLKKLFFFFFNF